MTKTSVATVSPKRTVKAMSRKQLEKQLEGMGVELSNDKTTDELKRDVEKVTSVAPNVSENPFNDEY